MVLNKGYHINNIDITIYSEKIKISPIKLKYEQPTLGCYDPLSDLSQLIATWSRSPLHETQTIYERIPKKTKSETTSAAKEQLELFVNRYPNKSILFKQNITILQQGGRWIK